jgi:hypothetical protein
MELTKFERQVTMEEAGEIQIAYHADRSPESIEAWQRYINSVLSRRHAAQKAPAPSAQEIKLVERDAAYYKERYNATLERESQLLEQLATAETAVRPQIEAERGKEWERAIRDTTVVCDMKPNLREVFMEDVLSGLTPAQEPKERVVVCVHLLDDSIDGFDVRVDDQLIAQFTGKHEAERYAAGLRAEIGEKVRARLTPAQELEERKSVKDLLCARISGQNVCFDADGYDANIIAAYRRGRAEIGEK